MSTRSLTAATLLLALSIGLLPVVQAQSASAPESAGAPAPAAGPAAAPTAAAAPAVATAEVSEGKVAYYGRKFAGRKTASGERFNPSALTMAHKSLPFGTMVKVTNLKNDKSVVVRVNDRGPTQPDRVGDLSAAAARKIDMIRAGVVDVRLEVVGMAEGRRVR